MYFNIALAIDRKGKKINDLSLEARKGLARFDHSLEVSQYKRYLDQEEIKSIAEEYGLSIANKEDIAKHIQEYHGQGEGGGDEKGVYELSAQNPEGQFDHYEVFYYATPDDFEGKILGKDWPLVRSFVTPELEWIEGYWGNIEGAVASGEEDKYYEWKDRLKSLLDKYKDCAIFIAKCHF